MKRHVLVLGGSGFVGTSVCEALVERNGGAGGRIVVPTRRAMRARHVQTLPGVEVVQADVHDDADLRRLLRGVDAVINLVAILHGTAQAFEHVHVALPRRLAAACAQAGVHRLVQVSALGADPQGPSQYQRSKGRGEQVLQEAAAAHGLALTVLRPSVIFGVGDRFLNLFAGLQRVLPVMALAGSQARFQPVWVEDVAQAIVRSLDEPAAQGLTIECAGPHVYTLGELVRLAGRWAGCPRPQIALPMALGRLQALALEFMPGGPLMSRDNLDSMRVDNVATGRLPGLQALGIQPTALEDVAPGYLGAQDPRGRLDAFRAMARRRG